MLSYKTCTVNSDKFRHKQKWLLIPYILIFTLFFLSTAIVQALSSWENNYDISSTEIIQGFLDDDVNTSLNKKIQKAKTLSSLFIVNFSLPQIIISYLQKTTGYTISKKMILRL